MKESGGRKGEREGGKKGAMENKMKEGKKEERQAERGSKTMRHSSWDHMNCVSWSILSHYICSASSELVWKSQKTAMFGLEPLVPSSWCTCIHYISLCKTDLLYSLFTSSSFQFCEPQWIPLYLILFSFAIKGEKLFFFTFSVHCLSDRG